jgi:hypothetical protein
MGHDQRADALQPRGILGFTLVGGEIAGAEVSKWTLAGNAGGEANIDPVRGNIAEGVRSSVFLCVALTDRVLQGFHAERLGWHLPGFDDSHWVKGTPEQGLSEAGVRFYRSNLRLDVPAGHDAALGFNLSAPAGSTVRAQLYVNGYQVRALTSERLQDVSRASTASTASSSRTSAPRHSSPSHQAFLTTAATMTLACSSGRRVRTAAP